MFPASAYSSVSILVKASADDDVPTVLGPSGDHVLEAIAVDETTSRRKPLGREDYFLGDHGAPRGGNLPSAIRRPRYGCGGRVGVDLKTHGQTDLDFRTPVAKRYALILPAGYRKTPHRRPSRSPQKYRSWASPAATMTYIEHSDLKTKRVLPPATQLNGHERV
ncbi:hypothetical protein MCOR02_005714 [Pyricularia oryzae]|nr:hypothetical protein MCOR01_007684 [Pyricularia oryzae]KAH9433669.1 hypothetical protein MCOR02_005714 [Pyricularia oryzae]KAI6262523.1 hypothetical protein MCOR19_001223 [Pyricularia oryzae]KAI6332731.1 hypothetical protein MCOR29_001256 [Pyricularia oryzae]KAI6344809.1 hypothetical protein MCOR30_001067 [Pyricularia oryzae]